MAQTGLSTFDLGELDAGTDIEVALLTPAVIRLVPSEAVTALLPKQAIHGARHAPLRRFRVPRSGRWRLLVEHADERKKGGCSIRLFSS